MLKWVHEKGCPWDSRCLKEHFMVNAPMFCCERAIATA
jgi:hypothetical protein